ncbi:MAG: phage tail tape measure protein [Ruminiclostridium sp.]|jgi:TP901 family phage tail tape measure protein|nr:phage tail tape measure protein [Ruminiclostridium sp.]
MGAAIVIDVEARFTDHVSSKAGKAEAVLKRLERHARTLGRTRTALVLSAVDRATSTINRVQSAGKRIVGKVWRATVTVLDKATAPLRKVFGLLRSPLLTAGVVLGIGFGARDLYETYHNFESVMSQVQAISGATAQEMESLNAKAKEMGSTTKFTAAEAGSAFSYMAMAGWKTADMLNGIEGIMSLAAASGEDLATTSDIVTDALTAFRMQAKDSGRFADVLAAAAANANTNVSLMGETFKYVGTAAGSLGYSVEDVALMTGLMANTGLKGSMAGTSLNSIITRLATNTRGATDAIKGLGVEFYNQDGSARKLSTVMGELRTATAEMTAEQKSSLAKTVAGVEAQKGLLAILNASEADYNKLADAIANADGAAARMAETMQDNLSGSVTKLQSAAEGVKIALMERIAPYLRQFVDWLTAKMPDIQAGAEHLLDMVVGKAEKVRSTVQAFTGSDEWAKADFGGKVKIAWDKLIAEPFSSWWSSSGESMLVSGAMQIGEAIGHAILSAIQLAFQSHPIAATLLTALGLSNLLTSVFATVGTVSAGAKALAGAPVLGRLIGSTGTAMVGGSGLLGGLANAGYALTGGAAVSGLSGAGAALLGGMGVAGGAIGGITLLSGLRDLAQGNAEGNKGKKSSGLWKVGGVAGGAATGALIGSIVPVIGTAIGALVGAGIGGVAGWAKGASSAKKYAEAEEEAAREAERLVQANLAGHFGDIALSAQEVSQAVDNLFGADTLAQANGVNSALRDMNTSFSETQARSADLKKTLWLNAHTSGELGAEQVQALNSATQAYTESAGQYLEDARYASAASIEYLLGSSEKAKALSEQSTKSYEKMGEKLSTLRASLEAAMSSALKDNVISLDEQASIDTIRSQIDSITQQIAQGDFEAELNIMQAKLKTGDLTPESFQQYTQAAREKRGELDDTAWQSYGQGAKGLDESGQNALLKGTLDKTKENLLRQSGVELEAILGRYRKDLGVLGGEVGTMLEQYTTPQIVEAAGKLSEDTRGALSRLLEGMAPDVEAARTLADRYKAIGEAVPEGLQSYLKSAEFYSALSQGQDAVQALLRDWKVNADVPIELNPLFNDVNDFVFSVDANVNADWTYNQFQDAWISPDKKYSFKTSALVQAGWTIPTPFDSRWISPDGSYSFHTNVNVGTSYNVAKASLGMGAFGIKSSYFFNPSVTIQPKTSIISQQNPLQFLASKTGAYRGGLFGPNGPQGFSDGGMVRGGAQLVTVAEEGNPEMIIPLGSQRRERGRKLWERAGHLLDIPGFARGGLVGDSGESSRSFSGDNDVVPISGSGDTVVQVDIGGITIHIDASGNDGDLVAAVREQKDAIAEEIISVVADALNVQFANTPKRGGAA